MVRVASIDRRPLRRGDRLERVAGAALGFWSSVASQCWCYNSTSTAFDERARASVPHRVEGGVRLPIATRPGDPGIDIQYFLLRSNLQKTDFGFFRELSACRGDPYAATLVRAVWAARKWRYFDAFQ
jgi:hypothetical protein